MMKIKYKRLVKEVIGEPCVGIFWMLPDNSVITYTDPLSESDKVTIDGKTYYDSTQSHINVWDVLGDPSIDYETYPRGRITAVQSNDGLIFNFMADRKILDNAEVVSTLESKFNLTNQIVVPMTDPHYRT